MIILVHVTKYPNFACLTLNYMTFIMFNKGIFIVNPFTLFILARQNNKTLQVQIMFNKGIFIVNPSTLFILACKGLNGKIIIKIPFSTQQRLAYFVYKSLSILLTMLLFTIAS